MSLAHNLRRDVAVPLAVLRASRVTCDTVLPLLLKILVHFNVPGIVKHVY